MGVGRPDEAEPTAVPALVIEGLAAGGAGVARRDGCVWMVVGGLPGDTVVPRDARAHRRFVEARVGDVVRPSPERRPSPCPLQSRCGGCPWMPLDEGAQRRWKRRIVEDALVRIGGLRGVSVAETVPSPADLGYRNKVEFAVGRDAAGRRVVGLHAADPAQGLIDVARCLLQDEGAGTVLLAARAALLDEGGARNPALGDGDEPARLVVRRSTGGGTLVALRGPDVPWEGAARFARRVQDAHASVRGVVRLLAPRGRRGGARTETIVGSPWVVDRLAGTTFRLPAATFFQVNPGAAERLATIVLSACEGPANALELYGGVGAFGLALARRGAAVTIVDADPAAVACGRDAAAAAGLAARYETADVRAFLERPHGGPDADLVLADPPRTGFGRGVAAALARLSPPRIVVVSCDPATLARDLRALAAAGYRIRAVTPVDLFPQTAHVEVVAGRDLER